MRKPKAQKCQVNFPRTQSKKVALSLGDNVDLIFLQPINLFESYFLLVGDRSLVIFDAQILDF